MAMNVLIFLLCEQLGQLAGNHSGLSLKERSQLNDQDLFNLAKRLHVVQVALQGLLRGDLGCR